MKEDIDELRELRMTLTGKDKYHQVLDCAGVVYPEPLEKVLTTVEVIVDCAEEIEEIESIISKPYIIRYD